MEEKLKRKKSTVHALWSVILVCYGISRYSSIISVLVCFGATPRCAQGLLLALIRDQVVVVGRLHLQFGPGALVRSEACKAGSTLLGLISGFRYYILEPHHLVLT